MEYRDKSLSPRQRAEALLSLMTTEEKLAQLKSVLLFGWEKYANRDFTVGHVRDVTCFLPPEKRHAEEAARWLNEDTRRSVEASRFGIPVMQNGEALHGAQWGYATSFPQSIMMASTFNDELVYETACVVAKELRAVGVRQVFAPVVNVVRDCRWGRTEETYGESVTLNARMGAAFTKGLEENGVVASPKHFVDNYATGGRDSNASLTSQRELREVFLEPFYACFTEGKARSVMLSYNSVDGVPASCNRWLMEEVLRKEWGFEGFTISDYGGVSGVCDSHFAAPDQVHAQAKCLNAGMDVELPNGYGLLSQALEQGLITEETVDKSVLRVLQVKFELGLMDDPYVDPTKAGEQVLTEAHLQLAQEAAEQGMVLLKNENGILPLDKAKLSRIGVFGPAATMVATGGYSGCSHEILTPLEALQAYLGDDVQITHRAEDTGVGEAAADCDVLLYFAAILEGEGHDRCDIRLPDNLVAHYRDSDGGIIIGANDNGIRVNQHRILEALLATGKPVVVVLVNGAPIDTEEWGDRVDAILEAWYPGQRGGQAIVRTLFGDNVPGGKLPISFPLCMGQVPIHHDGKPSGRGYGYIENSGKPRYSFGYGLSYTTFALANAAVTVDDAVRVTVEVTNTGDRAGDEVVQVYLRQKNGSVVRPLKEIKGYQRVSLQPGETKTATVVLNKRAFCCCDQQNNWGLFDGDNELLVGTSAEETPFVLPLDSAELEGVK